MNLKERGITVGDLLIILIIILTSTLILKTSNNDKKTSLTISFQENVNINNQFKQLNLK